jgi:hypothetical protein
MTEEVEEEAVVQAEAAAQAEAAVSAAVAAGSEETQGPGKCIRRLVPTAGANAKFPSSRLREGRFTAESASRNTDGSEIKGSIFFLFYFFLFYLSLTIPYP